MLPLVTNQMKYLMFAEPKLVQDQSLFTFKLSQILQMEEASITARLDKTKTWVAIRNGVDRTKKDAIDALHLPGVGFDEQPALYYPEGSSAAHILGFVGKNNDGENVGYFGIEGFYDKDLSGLPGLMRSDRDLIGRPIFLGTQEKIEPENGRDLVLTIDKTVQDIVKRKLKEGLEQYGSSQGCAIVANPNTGEILALSCLPDFDPDTYYDFPPESYKNSAISDTYEPGSTFKPLVMAAAIQEKVLKADSVMNESGPVTIDKYTIQTWNNQYEGNITMTRVLEKSSNVGMVYVGEKLGRQKLYEYIRKFGFGDLTGVDLDGEVPSYLRPMRNWYGIDFSTATFGQGIAVTPVQMIAGFSAVINGGHLMRPYVVKQMISDRKTQDIQPKEIRRILSDDTSSIMRKMLVSTIENGETKWLRPKGYQIGGKTGTAQIALQGHYDASKTIASFIGFAPVTHPEFVGLVIVREPKTSQWGSETAAPIFFQIAKELIVYYNITPEHTP